MVELIQIERYVWDFEKHCFIPTGQKTDADADNLAHGADWTLDVAPALLEGASAVVVDCRRG